MEIFISATSKVNINYIEGAPMSRVDSTDLKLDVSPEIDIMQYYDNEGLPNKDGSEFITIAFVHGLIGNIHMAHQNGFRDSAEHLRYIISELERGFVEVATISKI